MPKVPPVWKVFVGDERIYVSVQTHVAGEVVEGWWERCWRSVGSSSKLGWSVMLTVEKKNEE